jgi:hypothetical protein
MSRPSGTTSTGMNEPSDANTESLRSKLESLGVPDAKDVAAAFASGDKGQLLRALVLRQIWIWEIDAWRDKPGHLRGALTGDAASGLERILATGADPEDVSRVARAVAHATAFGVLYAALNLGTSDSDADSVWDLVSELADDERRAFDALWALHESLLSADPSGREGQ